MPKFYQLNYTEYLDQLLPLLRELETLEVVTPKIVAQLLRKYPKNHSETFSKDMVVAAYRNLAGQHGLKPYHPELLHALQMKPTRTISGVTPVTVLTKPFPCPGKCIFCPNDIRMPKSYLADEPGAQRAERNSFDPYLQTYNRLTAFRNIGHQTAKVELIILGGTWSYYPEAYQVWFVKECFRALNDFSNGRDDRPRIEQLYCEMRKQLEVVQAQRSPLSFIPGNNPIENEHGLASKQLHGDHLEQSYNQVISDVYVAPEKLSGVNQYQAATWDELCAEQKRNETASCRNVGLVIETRPDNISEAEVVRIRKLGCTKTQIGFQSLNDQVLAQNKRGHDVAATRRAVFLLRQAGFKIHAHWMPNLYGSSVQLDKAEFGQLFNDPDFKPDELKIYPCSLIESAELMEYYRRGEWQPYSEAELLDVLSYCMSRTPEYCRLTRVIRDIPSPDIVTGNKKTNFREMAEQQVRVNGKQLSDIRAREVKNMVINEEMLELQEVWYETSVGTEVFLQFVVPEFSPTEDTASDKRTTGTKVTGPTTSATSALNTQKKPSQTKIAGFLRLSLPKQTAFIAELQGKAVIREVHVYGQTLGLGEKLHGRAQHLGLGTRLIQRAKALAAEHHFPELAVISAVGTREYYRHRGFRDGELYQSISTATT